MLSSWDTAPQTTCMPLTQAESAMHVSPEPCHEDLCKGSERAVN